MIDERSEVAAVLLHGHDRTSEEPKGLIPCGIKPFMISGMNYER